ncbi:TauD/TfdA dioxygenase family protein [Streptomyces rapamycinicus]|uniref:Taurine dioxygenase n=2 Tax=Streptomyces rapamycinicus TaxID=1226757 RepID=A0A0A0NU47_STRRN|nr:TauD/TfdA family dioxygenase [Streptomyces rapamycinicus]AGP60854.1 taurine dioxygenase [Streptomyces rapamycinicus NRRL 5491]MBB4787974.1 taurine dioxygenase [Streptomyces rapamycinicus]RLV72312.1 taurine dioxygenase [Streptomyces rapamycinicus NRRL 5491]UTP36393.1 TauD/TfdA family dioxygenase [Streptomyces rapamycinicus NRRL 5491]
MTVVDTPPTTLREATIPPDGMYEGARVLRRLPEEWEERPYERFEIAPLGRVIGAEIRGLDLSRPLEPALREELNRALLEWKVLFFRGQHLTSEQQRGFARNWGELETNPLLAAGSSEDVVRFDKASGATPTFENVWHTDVTFRTRPALGAVLQLREVPPVGGDTMWADMAAAYDNLPAEVRERVDGATAVHDVIPGFVRFYGPERLAPFQEMFPPVEHPVVRTHPETGRRTLFVNTSFTTRITGMGREESDRLLSFLCRQAHVPEYQVRFHWQPGDIAFWDNRATQHYAVNDYAPHRRVAERVAIEGDRPF